MRRFRFLFAVCALAVLAPLAFLVRRAVYSVALDRQMRHQTVAERVFDEMERSLSRLLEREESRPFDDFGMDRRADVPFVVGSFQIDPGGTIAAWPGARATHPAAAAELERLVVGHWRGAAGSAPEDVAAAAQSPGTTVALRGAEGKAGALRENETGSSGAYDALRSLNKAVEERGERQARLAAPPPQASRRMFAAGGGGAQADEMRERSDLARAAAPAGLDQRARPAIALSPMSGRLIDPRHLMLYRTVVRDREGYRQGVVLDLGALGDSLREQALGSDGLARHAEVAFWTAPDTPPALAASEGYVYQHRFAEPFDDLTARLMLRPLPGVGSVIYVYTLSGLLLAVGGLGLAALYRMVSVTVRFAERRSNFVAAVSHELKTPLTAIRMYGEMLRDGLVPSDAKRAEYYRHITVESERLSRLINNVLELGHLEKGGRDIALVAAPVDPVLREVAALLRPHVEREGFELAVESELDLPPVRFDRDALVQVLYNLVDNAAKYSRDASTRRIVLRAWRDGAAVCVAVRDHGPGVASRHLGKIFEPFYRVESELTRRHKGTGIGLALVRGLAERMGARVSGRNAPGGGFEVEVRFPAQAT